MAQITFQHNNGGQNGNVMLELEMVNFSSESQEDQIRLAAAGFFRRHSWSSGAPAQFGNLIHGNPGDTGYTGNYVPSVYGGTYQHPEISGIWNSIWFSPAENDGRILACYIDLGGNRCTCARPVTAGEPGFGEVKLPEEHYNFIKSKLDDLKDLAWCEKNVKPMIGDRLPL